MCTRKNNLNNSEIKLDYIQSYINVQISPTISNGYFIKKWYGYILDADVENFWNQFEFVPWNILIQFVLLKIASDFQENPHIFNKILLRNFVSVRDIR